MTNKHIEEVKQDIEDMAIQYGIPMADLESLVIRAEEQALLKQREMIMECLPKNKGKKGWVEFTFRIETGERKQRQSVETNYDLGWNECNQQFLDNIKDKGI